MSPSRAMISGELSWSFVAVCFAIAGSGIPRLGVGSLHQALKEHASPLLWAVLLGAPAACLFAVSLREWCAHSNACRRSLQRWSPFQLDRSAMWRSWCCLASIFGWLYIFKVLVSDLHRASVLAVIALGACIFMGWFYKENRRVRREIRGNTTIPGHA
jgi:hypothetical protein